ncbi:MAG: DUF5104 domain-containing protein [Oscillospiraceae bacterium]|nr:DUF5104 domain-containing protein [Oscillospiraceae bacterium]
MFKKLVCVIICAAMLCSLTGCAFLRRKKEIDPKRSPYRYVEYMIRDMQDYLKEGDAESLSVMFGDYLKVTADDVQKLLAFIDGEIVSIDRASIEPGGGKKREVYIEYAYGGEFNISTSSEKEYVCYFTGYAVYDEKPEKIGLENFSVVNLADEKDRYGVGYSFNEKGQQLDLNGKVIEKYLK